MATKGANVGKVWEMMVQTEIDEASIPATLGTRDRRMYNSS